MTTMIMILVFYLPSRPADPHHHPHLYPPPPPLLQHHHRRHQHHPIILISVLHLLMLTPSRLILLTAFWWGKSKGRLPHILLATACTVYTLYCSYFILDMPASYTPCCCMQCVYYSYFILDMPDTLSILYTVHTNILPTSAHNACSVSVLHICYC